MICDTHMHVYDGAYPTAAGAVVLADDASVADYRTVMADLDIERVVVVQPSAYGLDNSCQLAAMAELAAPRVDVRGVAAPGVDVRGVMVVDADVHDDELERLTALGVRGARFHMLPGGAVPWDHLDTVASRVAEFGWHIQLQLNGRDLADRHDQLADLPGTLVIDHVGRFMPPVSTDHPAFEALRSLLDTGRTWVKISAPYESSEEAITDSAHDHADVTPLIEHLVEHVPERLVWATNWPHPGRQLVPSSATLRTQRERWLPTETLRRQVLVTNPDHLYFS